MIELSLKGQKLAVHTPLVVAGTVDYLTVQIYRDSPEWKDLKLHVFFQQNNLTYEILTDGDFIGTDAHLNLMDGEWSVSVVGYEFDGDTMVEKVTTNTIGLTVAPAPPDAGESLPYTPPSAYEQIEAIARSVREDADNGLFNGAKGDPGDQGPVGPVAAFSIGTVTTLAAGSDATATITGTDAAPVLNLGIPKGDQGVQGEQGPPGADGQDGASITVSSNVIEYQEGTSGTTAPTGAWTTTIPTVTAGNYLWTRVTTTFSDGAQAVSYSVSRMGIDGSGSVVTVNSVSPDGSGNVQLTASDVGALADTYTAPVTSVNSNTGDVTLTNKDVHAPRGGSVSAQLTSSGWFRAFECNLGNLAESLGAAGFVVDFTIGKDGISSEAHEISLFNVYGNIYFKNEHSVSATQHIDKIRYTAQSSSPYKGFVDIHLSSNPQAVIYSDFVVKTKPLYQSVFKASTLSAVNDTPSGETVIETYTLSANVDSMPDTYTPPVTSVNNKTGTVVLDNEDVNAPYGKSVSATLSSAGWYRVMKVDAGSTVRVEGGLGAIVNFNITRRQGQSTNEVHGITLDFVRYPAIAFVNENSNGGTLLIDKIRYNTVGTVGYIDIHYTGTAAEEVAVCFDVNTLPSYFSSFTAETLQSVADAPTGETVLTTYSFSSNTRNGALLIEDINVGSATLAAGAATSITKSLSKTGYTPLGVVGFYGTANGNIAVGDCYVNASGVLNMYIMNTGTSSKTPTMSAKVLWQKD